MGTSLVALSIKNIKTRASREMTSRKNNKIFDFNGVNVAKHWHVAGRENDMMVFRPLLCTLFRLNWTKQTPGIMRRN